MSARWSVDAPVYLVGFMAAGKTTAGRELAERLGWEFADTDALVERELGKPIEAIFRESGEGVFREAEWNALRSLDGRSRLVVATGGGLYLGVVHRAFIRARGVSCWLDVPLSLVIARAGDTSSRPLLASDDALLRRSFFERRRAAYALADVRIDASRGSPEEVAAVIADRRRRFYIDFF